MISFGMTLNPVLTTHRAPSDAPGDLAGRVGRLISLGIDTVTATEIVATPNLHQSPP
jgi:hypothetical protein